jgi:hypothetical protein
MNIAKYFRKGFFPRLVGATPLSALLAVVVAAVVAAVVVAVEVAEVVEVNSYELSNTQQ